MIGSSSFPEFVEESSSLNSGRSYGADRPATNATRSHGAAGEGRSEFSGHRRRVTRAHPGAGGGLPLSRENVRRPLPGVFGGGQRVSRDFPAHLRLLKIPLEVGDAPAAASTGTTALAQLAGAPKFVQTQEIDDLPLRDVEAVADRIFRFQVRLLPGNHQNVVGLNAEGHTPLCEKSLQNGTHRGLPQ